MLNPFWDAHCSLMQWCFWTNFCHFLDKQIAIFFEKGGFFSVNSTNFANFFHQIFFHKQTPDHCWCYIRKLKIKWNIYFFLKSCEGRKVDITWILLVFQLLFFNGVVTCDVVTCNLCFVLSVCINAAA
jgi:hypothetical protein